MSENALLKASAINPELPSIYLNQARLLLKQVNYLDALKKAEHAYKLSPEDPECLNVYGSCLIANQRANEATPFISKSLQLRPNYAEALANMAQIRLKEGEFITAIEYLEKATTLKPHLGQIWSLLGIAHYQNRNLQGAIDALLKVSELDPEDLNNLIRLGEFLRQAKRITEAIKILQSVVKLSPENTNAWTNLGVTLQQHGDLQGAKFSYEKSLEINSKSAEVLNNLGAIEKEYENWDSGLKYFERAIAINPDFAEAHNNLGIVLHKIGKYREAEESYKIAIAIKPTSTETYNNLGTLLMDIGRIEESEASLRKAINLQPTNSEAQFNLSLCLIFGNRLLEAKKILNQILINGSKIHKLKASIYLAILMYLEFDIQATKKLLLNSQEIISLSEKKLRNSKNYWYYLYNLVNYHKDKKNTQINFSHEKIYTIGESHSLVSHGVHLKSSKGKLMQCESFWIEGCKQYHLGGKHPNKFKFKFDAIIKSLPIKSEIILVFGEIDCRINEGILSAHDKFPERSISSIIKETIVNYLNFIDETTSPYFHRVTIQGVPCPNINNIDIPKEKINRLIDLISEFNATLRNLTKEMGFNFIDIHALTNRGDGFSNAIWHIDAHHISPDGILEAWCNYLRSA